MESSKLTKRSLISNSNIPSTSMDNYDLQQMDSRIWRNLPQPLLDRVLVFLPLPAFFRARTVCRRWFSLLYSSSFLQLHLTLAPRRQWLVFFEQDPPKSSCVYSVTVARDGYRAPACGYLLDTHNDTWYRIPLEGVVLPGFTPAASSGGILCFISDAAGPKTVILGNPLSRLAGQLPVATRPRLFPSVGLKATDHSLSVVVAGDDLISPFAVKNLTTEAFHVDGATGLYSPWTTTCQLPRLCNLESGRMVFKDGKFYCMSHSPFSVLAYDVLRNEWSKIQAPMRRFLRSPSLVECNNKIILASVVEKSKLNVPRSVRLWELQPSGGTWTEIERMPMQFYDQFASLECGRGFECVPNCNVVALSIKGSDQIIMFDLVKHVWRWAPSCRFRCNGGGTELRGFGFEPRLATPAIGLIVEPLLPSHAFIVR